MNQNHRSMQCAYLFLIFCVFSAVLAAEEEKQEVVVTPNRYASSASKFGGSLTVLTSEDIEKSQKTNVSDILRDVPGLDVVRSGGHGGNVSIFMRGANSEHTLVLLDGIELNNPVNPSRAFNFSDLTLDNIERIEVIRGPQSSIWGSDAIGGVINIISKTATDGVGGSISSEAGSYNRFTQKAGLQYGEDNVKVTASVSREDEGGISAADARDGNFEKDGFENTTFSFRTDVNPDEQFRWSNIFRYNDSTSELDNGGGVVQDDANRELDNEQLFWRSEVAGNFFDNVVNSTLGVAISDHEFSDNNDPDHLNPVDILRSRYKGRLIKVDLVNAITLDEGATLVVGASGERERASSTFSSDGAFGPFEDNFGPESVNTYGYFADLNLAPTEIFSTTAGVRVDDHDTFDTEVTFRVTPLITIQESGTRIRGSVSSGFKAPSLSQLHSSFGNRDLDPEDTLGWEVGVDQSVADGLFGVGATFYQQDIDNLITFDSATFVFENINEAEIRGFEVYVDSEPIEDLYVRVDYTYLDAEDKELGTQLIRRAENQVKLLADYTFLNGKADIGTRVRFTGRRFDNDFSTFPSTTTRLGGFTVVDLLGNYQFNENVSFFARVENLFDKSYQEVFGFGTYGTSAFGGVKISLS